MCLFLCIGRPVYVGEENLCQYNFSWTSPAACPVQEYSGSKCKLSVPLWDLNVDLNILSKPSGYNVQGLPNALINVCGALDSSRCGLASGGCMDHIILGLANDTITWEGVGQQGLLQLQMSGGSPCHQNPRATRTVKVQFVCDPCSTPDKETGPTLAATDQCTYTLLWPTSQACFWGETCPSGSTTVPTTSTTTQTTRRTTMPTPRSTTTTHLTTTTAASTANSTAVPPTIHVTTAQPHTSSSSSSSSSHTAIIAVAVVLSILVVGGVAFIVIRRTGFRCKPRLRYQPVVSEFYNTADDDDDDELLG